MKSFCIAFYRLFSVLMRYLRKSANTIYIVKFDGLGDYVFLRDQIGHVRDLFPSKKLILIGNQSYQHLIKKDNLFDGYIFIEPKAAFRSGFNKAIYKGILQYRGNLLISFMFSPEHFQSLQHIVNLAKCESTITGFIPNQETKAKKVQTHLLRSFSTSIELSSAITFETCRYEEFFKKAFDRNVTSSLRGFDWLSYSKGEELGIGFTVVLGAGNSTREWPLVNVRLLCTAVSEMFPNLRVRILGICDDESFLKSWSLECPGIEFEVNSANSLEFVKKLSRSSIVMCNESSTGHLCARLDIPFICISNLNHYLRFHPYPENFRCKQKYVYPSNTELSEDTAELTRYRSPFSITAVNTAVVRQEVSLAIIEYLNLTPTP